jgi:hypothetical protein
VTSGFGLKFQYLVFSLTIGYYILKFRQEKSDQMRRIGKKAEAILAQQIRASGKTRRLNLDEAHFF